MNNKQYYIPWVPMMGVAVGILSVIPVLQLLNCLFCGWVLLGAGAAVKLVGDKAMETIEPTEGAIIGALTGTIGGLLSGGIMALLQVAQIGAMTGVLDQFGGGPDLGFAGAGVMAIMTVLLSSVLFAIFGALGGLASAAIFKQSGPGGYGGPPQGGFGGPPQGGQGGGFGGPPQGS